MAVHTNDDVLNDHHCVGAESKVTTMTMTTARLKYAVIICTTLVHKTTFTATVVTCQ